MALAIVRSSVTALALLLMSLPVAAQTRGTNAAGSTGAGAPAATPVPPKGGQGLPTPGGTPGRGPGGGSSTGLPDAVTILEILWRLPRGPGVIVDEGEGPPDAGPRPQSGGERAPPPRRPSRVVTLNPAQPFVPRPSPRGDGAAPAVTGAVVPEIREREVIVTLNGNVSDDTVYQLSNDLGLDGDTLYTSNLLAARVVRFRIPDARTVAEVVQQLASDGRVQVAQPNYVFTANGGAAQPLPVPQYAPRELHLEDAHKIASGKQVKVAVIDTAIDAEHPAFAGSVAATFDALGAKGEAELHGTSIAGIVSAHKNLVGVAPEARLLSVRAFAAEGDGKAQSSSLAILKGLDWSVLNGARVVNMSFAGPDDPLLGKAIAAAVKQGVTVVAAAGNGGPDAPPAYPAAFSDVIAVTAVDDKNGLYKQANRGDYIAVAAPGVDIIGAAPKGAYEISSGTSMAAAHISGIAALMLEKNPKLTPKGIRDALEKSARKPADGDKKSFGAGVADAVRALDAL